MMIFSFSVDTMKGQPRGNIQHEDEGEYIEGKNLLLLTFYSFDVEHA